MQQQEKMILPLVKSLKRNGVRGKKESCIQIAPFQNQTRCFVFLKKGRGAGIYPRSLIFRRYICVWFASTYTCLHLLVCTCFLSVCTCFFQFVPSFFQFAPALLSVCLVSAVCIYFRLIFSSHFIPFSSCCVFPVFLILPCFHLNIVS